MRATREDPVEPLALADLHKVEPWRRTSSWDDRLWFSLLPRYRRLRKQPDGVAFTPEQAVEFCLQRGASLWARDPSGTFASTLHGAVALGRPELVELLLARGADPQVLDASGRTPLQYAQIRNVFGSRDAIVEMLSRATRPIFPKEVFPPSDYSFLSHLPSEWRKMKEEEDLYRALYVKARDNAVLADAHLLLADIFEVGPVSAGSAGAASICASIWL
jgi:hypothetical protein